MGAFQQWTLKQADDPVFKVYRREYKRRFAWIKAGRISDSEFTRGASRPESRKRNVTRVSSPRRNFSGG